MHEYFADTSEAETTSWCGKKYANVFNIKFDWTRRFTIKRKSEAHEGLSLLFQHDDVTIICISYGPKEQFQG